MSEIAFTALPLTPLRKVISARMTQAHQTIPHYRVSMDIEMDELLILKQQLMQGTKEGKISVNDLMVKACAMTLIKRPGLNVQWMDEDLHQYHTAEISVVIAVKGGVSTPVIRRAESKSVWEISREIRELAARAAKNTLKMSEIAGGSFSISNLGMYGVDQFDAIINPPQCAILALGATKARPVVKQGLIKSVAVMRATLSLDHRAIDGAMGAEFLMALRHAVERPHGLVE